MTSAVLSPRESTRLEKCEAIIEGGLQTFIEVGNALLEIRDSRLYRQQFGTFEDYCHERWQMTHRRANQLIGAAEVIHNLGTVVPVQPTSERQLRPLTGLEPEEQREAWNQAVNDSSNGKPTAKDVEAAVDRLKAPAKSVDADVKPAPGEDSQPEIPRANLKKLVDELWMTALRNVPPKQETEVAQLFLEMLNKKFPELKCRIK